MRTGSWVKDLIWDLHFVPVMSDYLGIPVGKQSTSFFKEDLRRRDRQRGLRKLPGASGAYCGATPLMRGRSANTSLRNAITQEWRPLASSNLGGFPTDRFSERFKPRLDEYFRAGVRSNEPGVTRTGRPVINDNVHYHSLTGWQLRSEVCELLRPPTE